MLTTLLAYLIARLQERSTWLGLVAVLTSAGVAVTPDQSTAFVTLGVAVAGLIAAVTKDTLPPVAGLVLLALALGGGLAACTPQELQVACQADAADQPILVALAPILGPDGAALAAADVSVGHPLVVAACAAVGGKPVAVAPAS